METTKLQTVPQIFNTEYNKVLEVIGKFFVPSNSTTVLQKTLQSMGIIQKVDVVDILSELSRLGLQLCGGAITSIFTDSAVNDLDFYLEDIKKKDDAIEFLRKYFPAEPYVSDNCITFKRKSARSNKVYTVQLITRFWGKPAEIFDQFDFTITMGAFSFSTMTFAFGERCFADLAKRRLVYAGKSNFPICALFRTKKYQDRGYKCPGSTVMHISLSIVRLEIKTYKELKAQLLGIDTMYLQNLLKQEKYDERLPVDYGEFIADAFEYMNVYHEGENYDE